MRSLTKAAFEQYLASAEARQAAQISLIAETATDYLTLGADRERLRVAQDTLQAQQASLDLTRGRFKAGVASELDLSQAETTVDAGARRGRRLHHPGRPGPQRARTRGRRACPRRPPARLRSTEHRRCSPRSRPACPSDVLLRRPDVLQAEHQLKAMNADIGAARATFFPTLALTASGGMESPGLSSLFSASVGRLELRAQHHPADLRLGRQSRPALLCQGRARHCGRHL